MQNSLKKKLLIEHRATKAVPGYLLSFFTILSVANSRCFLAIIMMTTFFIFGTLLLASVSASASAPTDITHADEIQTSSITQADIKQAITEYIQPKIAAMASQPHQHHDLQIGHIDHRLRLSRCPGDLDIKPQYPPIKIGRNLLRIACLAGKDWKIMVPVTLHIHDRMIVAKQTLQAGTVLSDDLLTYEQTPIQTARRGYYSDMDTVLGFRLKKTVMAGQILQASMLRAVDLVKKNQEVTIQNHPNLNDKRQLIQIRATGIALSDGAKGQRIKVKNKHSQQIITAIVVDTNLVEVNP